MPGTVTAGLVRTFREVSPRFLRQIVIPALSVRPRAPGGTDLHLESSQSQEAPQPPPQGLALQSTALEATFVRVIGSVALRTPQHLQQPA